MRRLSRIDQFLELVDWTRLYERWGLVFDNRKYYYIEDFHKLFIDYWKENYDMRIGQVLINLGLVEDLLEIWDDEEYAILLDQGIPAREITTWTSYYDKNKNLLEEPIERYIKDLDTEHINNIIPLVSEANIRMLDLLNDELKLRNEEAGT